VVIVHVKNAPTVSSTADDQKPWPDGYWGWFTLRSGRHERSATVSGLPSMSASRIAGRGRV
jgi:hypothetical protein